MNGKAVLAILIMTIVMGVYAEGSVKVLIYGLSPSAGSESILSLLSDGRVDFTFYELNETDNLKVFSRIVDILWLSGVEIIPPSVCLECYMAEGYGWEDLKLMFATPLTLVFRGGRLASIIVAVSDAETLNAAIAWSPQSGVKVFTNQEEYVLRDVSLIREVEKLTSVEGGGLALSLIAPIVSLAIVDSINPCTFIFYTALILLALGLGRGRALSVGLSFIMAVFAGYYVLGLGLLRFVSLIPYGYLKYAVGFLGLALALDNIVRGVRREFKPRTPRLVRRLMSFFVYRAYISPLISITFGFIASFTLLPCSGGPYVVGLGLLSTVKDAVQRYALLLIYNLVFITPLLIILIALTASSRIADKVGLIRGSEKVKIIPLTSGILLATACLILLST
jgi:cytochrome c biogenesis protein CcdA